MKHFFNVLFLFSTVLMLGQETLYMPLEFQKAYKNNTRSIDGKPGKNYWQNTSSYNIKAKIIPIDWKIIGEQEITYYNNSPDTLRTIVIKTYANHYKKGSARANSVPLETLTDGIKINDFKIDDEAIDLSNSNAVTNYSTFFVVELTEPLPPESQMELSMSWEVFIPKVYVNRIGAYDENSAFIGYWYPQVGVYDDIDGWDMNEYMASQEFYTELSDFEVNITVPKSYRVWATGDLKNAKDVLSTDDFKKYDQIHSTNEAVAIYDSENNRANENNSNSWHFYAENVRDFAFAVSDNFLWLSQGIQGRDKTISSNVVFDKQYDEQAEKIIQFQKASFAYLENKIPGITYPHSQFTTFLGVTEFDGMEFPMMANNGISSKEVENADVTFHELAHTYFPFLLGINEVKYSWMEEGWASYLTIKFIQDYFRGSKDENTELNRVLGNYLDLAGKQFDVPLFVPSNQLLTKGSQTLLSYKKPTFMYFALEELLGEATFKACLKEYFKHWSGKHAMPFDFMFTFNEVSGQNLNWFWNAWIFEYGYMDVALDDFKDNKLRIENVGKLPVPIWVKSHYKDGSHKIINKSPVIWKERNTYLLAIENSNELKRIELLSDKYPDLDITNNSIEIE